jgi:DNA-binding response OmpR family regulator
MTVRDLVAIIDDDSDLVNLFCDALTPSGISNIGFDDPNDAIKYLITHHSQIQLIVVDWRMPEFGGKEIIKLVSQMDSNIEIVLMSAYDLDNDELREIRKEDYLRKPVHMAQFVDAIKNKLVPAYEICVG